MLLLRESIWWMLATGFLGLLLGYTKGIPRWGFLLGLLLGPIGCGIVVMLPSQKRFRQSTTTHFDVRGSTGAEAKGPTCARCGQGVDGADKVCRSCGNVLMSVSYKVLR